MRLFDRITLGLLGMGLIAPITAKAQDAPAGYQPMGMPPVQAPAYASAPMPPANPVPVGRDGKPMPAAPMEAPHQHVGRKLCANCAAKLAQAMPPGKIVGCAHSRNGVCSACKPYLDAPGQFVVAGGPAAEAPGRAVASSGPAAARSGQEGSSMPFNGSSEDPMPVGVVQANFSPSNPMGAPVAYAPQMMPPGRAIAESGSSESTAGHEPYQKKSGGFPHPHILGHIFGWSGIGGERADERARRKSETHAMISYDSNGNSSSAVEDLPASVVYGKKR